MADIVTLVMESREKTGKGENGRLRRAGYVPCVIYGPEISPNIIGKVNMREIERILAGRWESTRLNVKLPDGREELCIIREAQRHPLTDQPLHVDFLHLVKGRKITVNIPVEVTGRDESQGIKDGGVLEAVHELEVETLPMSIPDVRVKMRTIAYDTTPTPIKMRNSSRPANHAFCPLPELHKARASLVLR